MTRASLQEEGNPSAVLRFHYNPSTLSFDRQVKFERQPNQSGREDPPAQFKGVEATTLRLQLLFDAMGSDTADGVQPEIDRLVSWTKVPETADQPTASPPALVFTWGKLSVNGREEFLAHLEQLKVTCELFDREGVPLRAVCDLTLKSVSSPPAGTNPTSGTERSRRRVTLRPGQSLQAIAYGEYGDAGAWRLIAEINEVDDPLRLTPGREVLLPDHAELSDRRR